MVEKICQECGKVFYIYPSDLKKGGRKHCSKICRFPKNRTHCSRGHRLTDKNTVLDNKGVKNCRVCINWRATVYRKKIPWISSFYSAQQRCENKNAKKYCRYGGRGIKFLMVMGDFKFLWFRDKAYLMKRPTIDRVDNDGHYELSNCRFLEHKENSGRDSVGEKHKMSKLSEKEVKEIRDLYKKGFEQLGIAKDFNVTPSCVWLIVHNKTWKHIV